MGALSAPTHRPASEASQILRSFRKWIAIRDAIADLDGTGQPDIDESYGRKWVTGA